MKQSLVLFIGEGEYLKFYRLAAAQLEKAGYTPVWIDVDVSEMWEYGYIDSAGIIENLLGPSTKSWDIELSRMGFNLSELYSFENYFLKNRNLFGNTYPYTLKHIRSLEDARDIAVAWVRFTLAAISVLNPAAIFIWNGRFLPYRAILEACCYTGQLVLTGEIGWIPGTVFWDNGPLSGNTRDLQGRDWEDTKEGLSLKIRAELFLRDYIRKKTTMVQRGDIPKAGALRQRFSGDCQRFLIFYACQVDWDTNIVVKGRRFFTNEETISFLLECIKDLPTAYLLVKPHPLEIVDKSSIFKKLIGKRGSIVDDIQVHSLIEASDCVVVRNSTVGFEALCYGKPVLVLEPAKYNHPKLVASANDKWEAEAFFIKVMKAKCSVPERSSLRKFIIHLLDNYLFPGEYEWFFKQDALKILWHCKKNTAYENLIALLGCKREIVTPIKDIEAEEALRGCQLCKKTVINQEPNLRLCI